MGHKEITMKYETADIYYFSGTGNTLLVARKTAETLRQHDVTVGLHRIETSKAVDVPGDGLLGIGFPVAAQGTYPCVWEFLDQLPAGNGRHVFMFDTLMMFSGGIVGPVKKLLTAKGYVPVGAVEVIMPNNIFPRKVDEEKNERARERGMRAAETFVRDLLEGRARWGRVPVISDLMGSFSRANWVWKVMKGPFGLSVNVDKCSKCGLCVKLCPVDNIQVDEEKTPTIGDRCNFCMRCYAFCPERAIGHGKMKSQQYRAVKAREMTAD